MDADRAVVVHPDDLSAWGRDQLGTPWFLADLRRRLADVDVGGTVEVFLDVGCCGDTLDVPLRLAAVEGGSRVGPDTAIDFEAGAAGGLAGGWLVQSRAGPGETG